MLPAFAEPAVLPLPALEFGAVKKLAGGFAFTEGPAVSPQGKIYFSDIPRDRIYVHDPESGSTTLWREEVGSSNGLAFTSSGDLVTCETITRRIGRYDGATGSYTILVAAFEGKRFNKPNDLVLDRTGGIFFTDPIYGKVETELDFEGVYHLAGGEKEARLIDRTCVKPNGIALSHDGATLYLVDNGVGEVIAFDVIGDGRHSRLAQRRLLCRLGTEKRQAGDGMALDAAGRLFVTVPEGIAVFDPSGNKVAHLDLPEQPTNCSFGRGSDRTTLYITARSGFYALEVSPGGRF